MTQCAVCNEPSTFTCSSCHNAFYCSKLHQKEHWKNGHKSQCTPYRIDYNDVLGRHLVATRVIQPGETILTESPLIYGPKMACRPICLGCHKQLSPPEPPEDNYYKCSRCTWPLCSEKCENSPDHQLECNLMASRNFIASIDYHDQYNSNSTQSKKKNHYESAYCVILPVRCMLMRKHNPELFAKLLELQDHLKTRLKTPLYNVLRANLVTFVQNVLGWTDWDDTEILRMNAILDTNAFEVREDGTKLRAIYPTAAMVSHDCVPNARHTFVEDRKIVFFAKMKIHKGEVISVSYTQPLKGTISRRSHLWQAKCFVCGCRRCMDNTELGTYASAFYCDKCKIGKIVALDTSNLKADWKCELCTNTLNVDTVAAQNDAIQDEIFMMDKTTPIALEEFLISKRDLLHPNNSFVLEVKYALTQLYGRIPGYMPNELTEGDLKRKISLCEDLLEIADIFDPGLSIFRGMLLYDLYETTNAWIEYQKEARILNFRTAQEAKFEILPYKKELEEILNIDPELKKIIDQLPQTSSS